MTVRMPMKPWKRTTISSVQSKARQKSWFQRWSMIQVAVCWDGSKRKC